MSEPIRLISLGAGVQSSTMALMAAHGEIEAVQGAVFADTGDEPQSVYRWLDWLETKLPFPVHRVRKPGRTLSEEMLVIRVRKEREPICQVCEVPERFHYRNPTCASTDFALGESRWVRSAIPAYIRNPDGSSGMMYRQCTADYKINQLTKAARRLGNVRRGEKEVRVVQLIGFSLDEIVRMKSQNPKTPWIRNEYPLIDRRITRHGCLEWMREHKYPTPPAVLACSARTIRTRNGDGSNWKNPRSLQKRSNLKTSSLKLKLMLLLAVRSCIDRVSPSTRLTCVRRKIGGSCDFSRKRGLATNAVVGYAASSCGDATPKIRDCTDWPA